MRPSRRHLSIAVLSALAVASEGAAQKFPPDPRVDRIFAKWDKADSSGCAVGVVCDGRFIY